MGLSTVSKQKPEHNESDADLPSKKTRRWEGFVGRGWQEGYLPSKPVNMADAALILQGKVVILRRLLSAGYVEFRRQKGRSLSDQILLIAPNCSENP